MRTVEIPFDLRKWNSFDNSAVRTYTRDILRRALAGQGIDAERDVIYRGGFGREEDLSRLLTTGSDYDSMVVTVGDWRGHHAVYASPLERVAQEPWCRGFDPLFWALKGHRRGTGYNPVSAIIAYRADKMAHAYSDVYAFRNGTPVVDAVAVVIRLELQHKTSVYVERNIRSPFIAWRGRRALARKMRRFIAESS